MSTRATIGMTLPNEMIVCIDCYRDGYPEHLGRILAKHYNTEEKIKELMKGGNLMDIETKPERCYYEQKAGNIDQDDCCPVTHRNLAYFLKAIGESGHDYGYLFRDGKWHVYNPTEWKPSQISFEAASLFWLIFFGCGVSFFWGGFCRCLYLCDGHFG